MQIYSSQRHSTKNLSWVRIKHPWKNQRLPKGLGLVNVPVGCLGDDKPGSQDTKASRMTSDGVGWGSTMCLFSHILQTSQWRIVILKKEKSTTLMIGSPAQLVFRCPYHYGMRRFWNVIVGLLVHAFSTQLMGELSQGEAYVRGSELMYESLESSKYWMFFFISVTVS